MSGASRRSATSGLIFWRCERAVERFLASCASSPPIAELELKSYTEAKAASGNWAQSAQAPGMATPWRET